MAFLDRFRKTNEANKASQQKAQKAQNAEYEAAQHEKLADAMKTNYKDLIEPGLATMAIVGGLLLGGLLLGTPFTFPVVIFIAGAGIGTFSYGLFKKKKSRRKRLKQEKRHQSQNQQSEGVNAAQQQKIHELEAKVADLTNNKSQGEAQHPPSAKNNTANQKQQFLKSIQRIRKKAESLEGKAVDKGDEAFLNYLTDFLENLNELEDRIEQNPNLDKGELVEKIKGKIKEFDQSINKEIVRFNKKGRLEQHKPGWLNEISELKNEITKAQEGPEGTVNKERLQKLQQQLEKLENIIKNPGKGKTLDINRVKEAIQKIDKQLKLELAQARTQRQDSGQSVQTTTVNKQEVSRNESYTNSHTNSYTEPSDNTRLKPNLGIKNKPLRNKKGKLLRKVISLSNPSAMMTANVTQKQRAIHEIYTGTKKRLDTRQNLRRTQSAPNLAAKK